MDNFNLFGNSESDLAQRVQAIENILSQNQLGNQSVDNPVFAASPIQTSIVPHNWQVNMGERKVAGSTPGPQVSYVGHFIVPDNTNKILRAQAYFWLRVATVEANPAHAHRWSIYSATAPGGTTMQWNTKSALNVNQGIYFNASVAGDNYTDQTTPANAASYSVAGAGPTNVALWIDGIDRTGALGGPWNADTGPLDILTYLQDANARPKAGDHFLTIFSNTIGVIEAAVVFYTFDQPLAGR